MVYLDGEDLLRLHKVVIDYAGGSHGVRDARLLASILESPKQSFGGVPVYPDIWQKAGAYMEKLAKFHVFVDGNKRTSLAAAARFLELNNYALLATNKEAETFVVQVVTKKLDVVSIATWLKRHSRKIAARGARV